MAKSKKKKKSKQEIKVKSGSDKQLLSYLKTWKTNRNEWKFEKVKQIRLAAGMLDCEKIPDDVFPIFVEYMTSSKGKMKDKVVEKATTVVEEMEKWTSLAEEEKEEAKRPDINKYDRAREILQNLL